MQPKTLALRAKDLMEDKKAESPIVIDISKQTSFAHYFVICHGNSEPHVKAIANNVADTLKKEGEAPLHIEGMNVGEWILVDFGPVIVHVFHKNKREFYNLEGLWGDAKVIYGGYDPSSDS